jgi:hypothetical protein
MTDLDFWLIVYIKSKIVIPFYGLKNFIAISPVLPGQVKRQDNAEHL